MAWKLCIYIYLMADLFTFTNLEKLLQKLKKLITENFTFLTQALLNPPLKLSK